MEIWSWKNKAAESQTNRIWQGLGLHLKVYGGLGSLLGARGRLLDTFWVSPGRSCACLGRLLGRLGTSRVTFTPLRRFLEGFGKGLGRVWDLKIAVFALSCAPCVSPVASHFDIGTPALPRYAPRSVTMRGGSPLRD